MNSQPDSAIFWCLEQLATENIDTDLLISLVNHIAETRGPESVEDTLRVRFMLAMLSGATEITADTLGELQDLAAMINQTEDPDLQEKRDALLPPAELMTLVKTEVVAQSWRNSVNINLRDLSKVIRDTFGQHPEAGERSRFDELIKAVTQPGFRAHIDRLLDGNAAISGLRRYVGQAQALLGPTLLQIVNDDINSGNYVPGQPMPEQAPIVQSQPADQIASPPRRISQVLPPRNNSSPTPNLNLQQAINDLHNAGGSDPIKQAQAQAQIILAAAAIAGAGAIPVARAPTATPSRLAFPTQNGRPVPEPLRRVSQIDSDRDAVQVRRRNRKWSDDEVKILIEACRKHGPGAWALIQAENSDIWGMHEESGEVLRTQVDLKDKWRNLTGFKGDKAHRNHPDAMAVMEEWQTKWQANGGQSTVVERRRAAAAAREQSEKGAGAGAAAEKGRKRKRGAAAAAVEEPVAEEEEAPETTEEQEQVESEGEAEENVDGEEGEVQAKGRGRPSKKAKRSKDRKNARKPAKGQRSGLRSKK